MTDNRIRGVGENVAGALGWGRVATIYAKQFLLGRWAAREERTFLRPSRVTEGVRRSAPAGRHEVGKPGCAGRRVWIVGRARDISAFARAHTGTNPRAHVGEGGDGAAQYGRGETWELVKRARSRGERWQNGSNVLTPATIQPQFKNSSRSSRILTEGFSEVHP
ncbi:hypothetical protein FIBSPDRAFT_891517 [Athelia psychrophila]|uniref:Uncharacterized protein n=1 Tax=Athelia psychrophila TaxID=1759441 RepID=A0A166JJ44_9AGAM|nr:hypothetical protein FIBSPDRAFT_891517 [Fibularhizoctonia sp. CBS 109695]